MLKKMYVLGLLCCWLIVSGSWCDAKGVGSNKAQNQGTQGKNTGANQGTQNKQSSKPTWSPTAEQQKLPAIVVKDKNRNVSYSFENLILADGYLCPGSAMAYQTLRTALPLLYGKAIPVKGDFTIVYGPSECAVKVFKYFMGSGYTSTEYLRPSGNEKGIQYIVVRNSTGAKVRITYATPAADGEKGGLL